MILNLLVTRICNLSCNYCRITKYYTNIPKEYPRLKYYIGFNKSYKYFMDFIDFLKRYDNDLFVLIYGGEPTLYNDFHLLIKSLYEKNVPSSVITNAMYPENVKKVEPYLVGLTVSLDPNSIDKSRNIKSDYGLEMLKSYKNNNRLDKVAEVVVDKTNYKNIYSIVNLALENNFRISVSIIEEPLNNYYDFAEKNYNKNSLLLNKDQILEFREIINDIKGKYPEILVNPKGIEHVLSSSNGIVKCGYKNLNSLTMDADGSIRNCLRLRGTETPTIDVEKYIKSDDYNGFINEYIEKRKLDIRKYCEGCSWTCMYMEGG